MDEKRPAVVGDLDRQGAGRQRYQIGEKSDLEVAAHLERIGKDARTQVHLRRSHEPRHAPAGQDEFLDEEHGQRQYPAAAIVPASRPELLTDEIQRQPTEEQAKGKIRQGEGTGKRRPQEREQNIVDITRHQFPPAGKTALT
jgi:hypothetical protein